MEWHFLLIVKWTYICAFSGLLKVKDPDTIEASLVAAEKLIRKGPDGLAEVFFIAYFIVLNYLFWSVICSFKASWCKKIDFLFF